MTGIIKSTVATAIVSGDIQSLQMSSSRTFFISIIAAGGARPETRMVAVAEAVEWAEEHATEYARASIWALYNANSDILIREVLDLYGQRENKEGLI